MDELERSGLNTMAQRREHRIREGAFIPRAGVAATVDEEHRRLGCAAALRALDILAHASLRPLSVRVIRGGVLRNAFAPRNLLDMRGSHGRPPLHERLVDLPKRAGGRGHALGDFRCAEGILLPLDGQVPEDVPHPVTETVSQPFDHGMDRAASEVRVAAVLNESQFRFGISQNMIALNVDRRIKFGWACLWHHTF